MKAVRRFIIGIELLFAICMLTFFVKLDQLDKSLQNRRTHMRFSDKEFLSKNRIVKPQPVEPLTILLPVTLGDFPRVKILDTSLDKYFNFDKVREFIFLVQDHEWETISERAEALKIAKKVRINVVKESVVVPEFAGNPDYMGWIKQQIIKLASYRIIKTEFYMTFDSDIIATKPCGVPDLILNGRARTNMCTTDSEGRPTQDTIIDWWNGAEKTLELKIPKNETLKFGVTPAIMSTDIICKMAQYVEKKFNKPFSKHLVDCIWNSYTEYAVYFVFASAQGLFYKYHTADFYAVYKDPQYNVWWRHEFDTWDGNKVFVNTTSGCFITMQSNTKVTADQVWDKVAPWLQ